MTRLPISRLVDRALKALGRWQSAIAAVTAVGAALLAVVFFFSDLFSQPDVDLEQFDTREGYTFYNSSWTPIYVAQVVVRFPKLGRIDSTRIGRVIASGERVVFDEERASYKVPDDHKLVCSSDPLVQEQLERGAGFVRLVAFWAGDPGLDSVEGRVLATVRSPLIVDCTITVQFQKANLRGAVRQSKDFECKALAFMQVGSGSPMTKEKVKELCTFDRADAPTN